MCIDYFRKVIGGIERGIGWLGTGRKEILLFIFMCILNFEVRDYGIYLKSIGGI